MKKSKGMSLEMVAGMILAIIGVLLVIGLAANNFSFRDLYCSTSSKVLLFLPHKGDLPPSPEGCRTVEDVVKTDSIEDVDKKDVSLTLSGGIVNCWQLFQGYGDVEKECFAYSIENLGSEIYENDINGILISQNLCPSVIENNLIDFGGGTPCGNNNQVVFDTASIKKGDYIIILYSNGAIHVR